MQSAENPVVGSLQRSSWAGRAQDNAARAAGVGREAPLDLMEEHLTDSRGFGADPERLVWVNGQVRSGWTAPADGVLLGCNEFGGNYVAKVQPFEAGGFELVCRSLDLPKIGAMMEGVRRIGPRVKPAALDQDNIRKAAQRAKRKVRLLTKNMGASHLVTFTRREFEGSGFWTPEDWSKAWDRFRRLIERWRPGFCYVAVLERHQKGNYHLHVAWVEAPGQKVNLNVVRRCWWVCVGGRGQGNVDVQYIKVREGLERADRVARYISKYTAKHFEDDCRFNKKRYWSSRQDVAEARRYILNVLTSQDALSEVLRRHGLDLGDYKDATTGRYEHFFPFPDGSGFWLAYVPGKHGGAPPPF